MCTGSHCLPRLICTPTLVSGSESTWSSEALGSFPLVDPDLQRRLRLRQTTFKAVSPSLAHWILGKEAGPDCGQGFKEGL